MYVIISAGESRKYPRRSAPRSTFLFRPHLVNYIIFYISISKLWFYHVKFWRHYDNSDHDGDHGEQVIKGISHADANHYSSQQYNKMQLKRLDVVTLHNQYKL